MSFSKPDATQKFVYIKTYGCHMNIYDSERMIETLSMEGYNLTDDMSQSNLIILNTCHIREKAAEKIYSELGRIRPIYENAKADKRFLKIAIAGCVAQAEGEEIIRRSRIVDLVFGPQTYHQLPKMISLLEHGERVVMTDFPEEEKYDFLPTERLSPNKTNAPVSAYLTVQEGCDKFCHFCVVPYTRGSETSRPVSQILQEAQSLVRNGAKEITLLGQNVNAYHGLFDGGDECSLGQLIEKLENITDLHRIRYMTSHPRDMDEQLIGVHGRCQKLMPFLHLPVQSGSNAILKAMNRQHTRDDYFELAHQIRLARPDIALSGDFIVGYPGETDEDFADTMDLIERVNYAQAYSFKYSPRPGTPGSEKKDQIPESIKADRLFKLQKLLEIQRAAFNQSKCGTVMDVLFEKAGRLSEQLVGRSPWLQPVHCQADGHQIGDLVKVEIISTNAISLTGKIISKK